MKIITFIPDSSVILQILQHTGIWQGSLSRDPPDMKALSSNGEIVYEPFDDGLKPGALPMYEYKSFYSWLEITPTADRGDPFYLCPII